jgi:hypothetical protein
MRFRLDWPEKSVTPYDVFSIRWCDRFYRWCPNFLTFCFRWYNQWTKSKQEISISVEDKDWQNANACLAPIAITLLTELKLNHRHVPFSFSAKYGKQADVEYRHMLDKIIFSMQMTTKDYRAECKLRYFEPVLKGDDETGVWTEYVPKNGLTTAQAHQMENAAVTDVTHRINEGLELFAKHFNELADGDFDHD